MTNKKYLEKLGKKIAELRKKKELTQVEFAKKVGIHRTSLTQIELGNVNSTINMLRTIAKKIGLSIEELVKIN